MASYIYRQNQDSNADDLVGRQDTDMTNCNLTRPVVCLLSLAGCSMLIEAYITYFNRQTFTHAINQPYSLGGSVDLAIHQIISKTL